MLQSLDMCSRTPAIRRLKRMSHPASKLNKSVTNFHNSASGFVPTVTCVPDFWRDQVARKRAFQRYNLAVLTPVA